MKKSVTSILSSAGLLLTTKSALAHGGHTHTLFHSHDNIALMTASLALVITTGAFIGYKLITVKRAAAKNRQD